MRSRTRLCVAVAALLAMFALAAAPASASTLGVGRDTGRHGTVSAVETGRAGTSAQVARVMTGNGFRVSYNPWLPFGARVWLNKARTDDAMDGQMTGCAFFALVPVIGTALGIACAVEAYLVKTTSHLADMCAGYDVTIVDPTHPKIFFYKGGFCS